MMDTTTLKWGVVGVFIALLLIGAVSDIIKRRIPNWVVIALIGLYVLALVLGVAPSSWLSGLGAAGVVLIVTYGLYLFGVIGAGDAKLFSAAALFVGLTNLATFALMTVLVGGLMAIGVLILHPKRVMRGMTAAGRAEGAGRGIPYGVAIALGAIAARMITLKAIGLG